MRYSLPEIEFTFAGFTFPRWIGTLPRGSFAERIARMREHFAGPYYHAPKPNASGRGFYLDSDGMPGLRYEKTGDSFSFNEFGDSIEGVIFRLPHSRGFLAGWTMGERMISGVGGEVYEDEDEARRVAHDEAERIANAQAEYEAEQRFSDEGEDE